MHRTFHISLAFTITNGTSTVHRLSYLSSIITKLFISTPSISISIYYSKMLYIAFIFVDRWECPRVTLISQRFCWSIYIFHFPTIFSSHSLSVSLSPFFNLWSPTIFSTHYLCVSLSSFLIYEGKHFPFHTSSVSPSTNELTILSLPLYLLSFCMFHRL